MRRREFITLLGGAVAAGPIAARAQQDSKSWRIGFLTPRSRPSPPDRDTFSDAFMQGMSDLGYSEGKNLAVEWRYADGDYKRLTGFATELAGMNLPVIVTYGTARRARVAGDNQDHPHRRRSRGRSGGRRPRREPGAPRRQYHRIVPHRRGHQWQTA